MMRCALTVAAAVALGTLAMGQTRITPIVTNLGNVPTFDAMYIGGPDGMIASVRGKLPVVEHSGRRALKIQVTRAGDYFSMGIAREWTRFYLDDYLPTGAMEVSVCGEAGGESVQIGIAEPGGRGRPERSAILSLAKYGSVTTQWQTLKVPIADISAAAKDGINLADCIKVLINNDGTPKPMTLYISEIRFTTDAPERVYPPIKLNQLGYRPAMFKIAKISAPVNDFSVVDEESGKPVFTGQAKPIARKDAASGDDIWDADFSAVKAPGKYHIEAKVLPRSDSFEIREDIYDQLATDVMRFYYLQRCNMNLEEKFAGKQAHEACHMNDKQARTLDGKDTRDVTGGWHDAGDNNKYPAFLAHTLPILLSAYDLRPEAFADGQLNIPESGNGIPDFVDELQYELDWLLKMQITSGDGDQAGAVYDRIHQTAAQESDPKGGKLQEPRRLLPPTNQSTAISAASWAMASRILATVPQCQSSAQKYLSASRLAWDYLKRQKADDRTLLLPAICLFDATGEEEFARLVASQLDKLFPPNTWIGQMADRMEFEDYSAALCNLAISKHDAQGVREKARRIVKGAADHVSAVSQKDGYGSPLWVMDHYCWSSTAQIGRFGYICIVANRFAPNPEYLRTAESTMHYTLGRNAVATSMVTRYGTRWTEIFHDIYGNSNAAILPMPAGYVPGGVNKHQSAGISAWAAKNWRPDPNNWTLNEPAVYYNAPMVVLSTYFAELKRGQ